MVAFGSCGAGETSLLDMQGVLALLNLAVVAEKDRAGVRSSPPAVATGRGDHADAVRRLR